MPTLFGVVMLLLAQVPGDGWGMADSRPGEVKRLYWDLFQTTEVWVTLSPVTHDTVAGPRFAFQALFPGRKLKGRPQRIEVKALGGDLNDLSLSVRVDGETTDLTGPGGTSFLIYPPCASDQRCAAIGVGAELKAEFVSAIAEARAVEIIAFGSTFRLSAEDRAGLRRFAEEIGLAP